MKLLIPNTVLLLVLLAVPVMAQEETNGNKLEEVTRDMKAASDHLTKKATSKSTQSVQEAAVAKLDSLIADLEEQRKRMGSGGGANPSMPAMQSTVRTGPGGMGELHGVRSDGDRWGELPAHERDRILQSLTEGFPPHYQSVLEAYYKRLAVEKRAEEPDPAMAPKAMTPAKPATDAANAAMKPAAAKPSKPVMKSEK